MPKRPFSILDYAMDKDINLIDTAEVYSAGGSEKVLGQWLSRGSNRQKVVLATKIAPPLGRERVLQFADDSLRRLQTDVIDLYTSSTPTTTARLSRKHWMLSIRLWSRERYATSAAAISPRGSFARRYGLPT